MITYPPYHESLSPAFRCHPPHRSVVQALDGLLASCSRPCLPAASRHGSVLMSTLTKPRAKKPARVGRKAAKQLRHLKPGQSPLGFLAGTAVISPAYDPAAPVFSGTDWKS
jgi:hypothetical protein